MMLLRSVIFFLNPARLSLSGAGQIILTVLRSLPLRLVDILDIPVIVLINGYSASAAELAAGALRDLGRATTVGEKSFGKGTVQIVDELADGSGIKFTIAKYYLPSGVTIDGTGIEPDISVELKPEDTEDLQLNRAIEELKKMIDNGS